MSGKAASCAASVSPAGPQPTISTSTSSGRLSDLAGACSDGSAISGLPGLKSVEMELHCGSSRWALFQTILPSPRRRRHDRNLALYGCGRFFCFSHARISAISRCCAAMI